MVRVLLNLAAVFVPLGMLVPMLAGLAAPGYSSIGQQLSELELLGGWASAVTRTGAITSGVAILAFSLALLLHKPRSLPFTACLAALFGVSMISNGVFTMGCALHGLYAMGLTVILVPATFAAEERRVPDGSSPDRLSLAAAVLTLLYLWANQTGLDPAATRGLTQRLGTVVMFGWFAYASARLLQRMTPVPAAEAGVLPGP